MLSSVEVENYRGFRQFRLSGLARVNLLVGKNACGKTSILEAVQLLASGGDPDVLCSVAVRRGEVSLAGESRVRRGGEPKPVVLHFFHGRELEPGTSFAVSSGDGVGRIAVRIIGVAQLEEASPSSSGQIRLFEDEYPEEHLRAGLVVRIESSGDSAVSDFPPLLITEQGAILARFLPGRYVSAGRRQPHVGRPVQFISPDSLEPRSMSEMWNTVITEGRESEVIRVMRILEPKLEGIFFLGGEGAYRYGGRSGILAAFAGTRRRDPLGSHGDGMRRLLALSVALIQSQGGVLLVDEIDTGLHYSIMGDMWRLLVQAARQSEVQVLATTHSLDCVKGLAWLCENYPDLAAEVSLQKIDCSLDEAVALRSEDIILAVRQGTEVR